MVSGNIWILAERIDTDGSHSNTFVIKRPSYLLLQSGYLANLHVSWQPRGSCTMCHCCPVQQSCAL